jgi:hypothetical protein
VVLGGGDDRGVGALGDRQVGEVRVGEGLHHVGHGVGAGRAGERVGREDGVTGQDPVDGLGVGAELVEDAAVAEPVVVALAVRPVLELLGVRAVGRVRVHAVELGDGGDADGVQRGLAVLGGAHREAADLLRLGLVVAA